MQKERSRKEWRPGVRSLVGQYAMARRYGRHELAEEIGRKLAKERAASLREKAAELEQQLAAKEDEAV